MESSSRYTILIEFAFRHMDFNMAELEAVVDMFRIKDVEYHPLVSPNQPNRPFCILSIPQNCPHADESADQNIAFCILSRCTLVRSVVELWGMGRTLEDCAAETQKFIVSDTGKPRHARMDQSKSWKITILSIGATHSVEEHEEMRAHFAFLKFPGPVKMKDSEEFVIFRESELDQFGGPLYPRLNHDGTHNSENHQRLPLACYFGRIMNYRRHKHRADIHKYTLKKRKYLGPTSMDAELSFIMTNLARVNKGSMVLDPFCGTGSIMLSCACRGAYTVGTDIDIRVLRGRSSEENVYSNFRQFELPRPELIRSDNANYHRHFVEGPPLYDAIVTDPPYGIRAGARQSGSRFGNPRPVEEDRRHDHIAQTKPYPVSDVMADLMDVAARVLKVGGYLVYIIPSMTDFDPESDLPRHPCLAVKHICYQPLSTELGRRVVALEKITEYDATQRQRYLSSIWKNGPESAEKVANIRERLIAVAKLKPNYEKKAARRKRLRKENREEKRKLARLKKSKA